MEELALATKGCVVSFASSHPNSFQECQKIIDGFSYTFWHTTGCYPQCFILTFPQVTQMSVIRVRSYQVKFMTVEKSTAELPQGFEALCEKEFESTDGTQQIETLHTIDFSAKHLRFTIASGYDAICAIYKVEVKGPSNTVTDDDSSEAQEEVQEVAQEEVQEVAQDIAEENGQDHVLHVHFEAGTGSSDDSILDIDADGGGDAVRSLLHHD